MKKKVYSHAKTYNFSNLDLFADAAKILDEAFSDDEDLTDKGFEKIVEEFEEYWVTEDVKISMAPAVSIEPAEPLLFVSQSCSLAHYSNSMESFLPLNTAHFLQNLDIKWTSRTIPVSIETSETTPISEA